MFYSIQYFVVDKKGVFEDQKNIKNAQVAISVVKLVVNCVCEYDTGLLGYALLKYIF